MSKNISQVTESNDTKMNKSLSHDSNTTNKYHPGEKSFAIFLFIFGSFFAYHSFLMYTQKPGASSYAAIPLFVSLLIMIFSTLIFIFDFKKDSINSGLSISSQIKNSLSYIFPKDVLVIIVLILLYCAALLFGLRFYLITPFFLWLAMSYLMSKNYLKNVLWTILSLSFIYIMFSFVFNVVLP